jgi:hypothetical protein
MFLLQLEFVRLLDKFKVFLLSAQVLSRSFFIHA